MGINVWEKIKNEFGPPENVRYARVRWLRRRRRWRSDREMRYYNDAPARIYIYIYIYVTLLIYGLTIMYRYYSRGHPNWLPLRRFPNGRTATTTGASESNSNNNDNKNHIYSWHTHTHIHKYRPTTIIIIIIIITTSPSIGIYLLGIKHLFVTLSECAPLIKTASCIPNIHYRYIIKYHIYLLTCEELTRYRVLRRRRLPVASVFVAHLDTCAPAHTHTI